MNKTVLRAVIAGLLLVATPQVAATTSSCCSPSCDPCCHPCDCCGDWEVGAHALLFQPLACRWDFASRSTEEQQSSFSAVATIDPSLDWGFRVWGKYIQDCLFVSVGYQWFEARDSQSLFGEENVAVRHRGNGDEAHGRLLWRYQNVDVRVGGMKRKCGSEMYGFINGRWVDLDYSRRFELRGTLQATGDVQHIFASECARFEGGALGLGFGGRKDLFCDIGLFGELNLLAVMGNHKTDALFIRELIPPTAPIVVTTYRPGYTSAFNFSPEFDFRIGIDYTWCCDCWKIVAEVGYELDYFWNVADFPEELSDDLVSGDHEWITHCEDVGFSGLFFGVRVLF